MRATLRLYAAVKPGRYLEAGTPTGLTGLLTHPSPRSHLLSVYGSTLEQLKTFPESSVYRQSTEALTKHRMNIIEQIKPAGYEEWEQRAQKTIEKHAGLFAQDGSGKIAGQVGDDLYVAVEEKDGNDDVEWDGEKGTAPWEGMKGEREARVNAAQTQRQDPFRENSVTWEPEPALETTQYVLDFPLLSQRALYLFDELHG